MKSLLGAFLLLCLSSFSLANAQVPGATVTGIVKDASGALVQGAQVTIANSDRAVERHGRSNSDGIYLIPGLQPGTYSLEIVSQASPPRASYR